MKKIIAFVVAIMGVALSYGAVESSRNSLYILLSDKWGGGKPLRKIGALRLYYGQNNG